MIQPYAEKKLSQDSLGYGSIFLTKTGKKMQTVDEMQHKTL